MNAIRNLTQGCARRGLVSVSHPPAKTGLVQGQQLQQHLLQYQQQKHQTRFISKYISKSAKKRIPLTTKRAGKGYYKGKGGTKEGRLNSKGRFLADSKKKLKLVVPDLEGSTVSIVVVVRVCVKSSMYFCSGTHSSRVFGTASYYCLGPENHSIEQNRRRYIQCFGGSID